MPAEAPAPPPTEPATKRRRGLSAIPFIGDLLAMVRLLTDSKASLGAKALCVAAIAYVVWPADLIPDITPFIFWLDDVGVVVLLRLALHRQLEVYRYPLLEPPPAGRGPLPPPDHTTTP